MSDETVNRFTEFDVMAALHQRLAQKKSESTPSIQSKTYMDPYQMMLNRKQQNKDEVAPNMPVQSWPEDDIKKLEEFCRQQGIVGFNCGRMNPIAALALLKQKLGVVDEPPKSEGYGPNYPYTEAMKKRTLLHG